jgi:hypothetical protein
VAIGFLVTAIRKIQDDDGPAWPKDPGGVTQVSSDDLGICGEQIGKRIDRQDQIERPVAEPGEITPVALLEGNIRQISAPPSRLLDHTGRNVDPGDRADLRRQSALDAATSVEHGRIGSQKAPFGQTAHDLTGGSVQNIGGAERIERHRRFRRECYCPVELLTDRGNRIAIIGTDVHQPVFRQVTCPR